MISTLAVKSPPISKEFAISIAGLSTYGVVGGGGPVGNERLARLTGIAIAIR